LRLEELGHESYRNKQLTFTQLDEECNDKDEDYDDGDDAGEAGEVCTSTTVAIAATAAMVSSTF
jgi:hypothetical protein